MCGIVGCLRREPDESPAELLGLEMLEQIRYRGPDEAYLHLEPTFFCGVRRLSIVNLAHGRQPSFSADGQVVAVLNGEIYNHRELKRELINDGYRIRSGSDAEIIPHAYQRWGIDFPSHFNGDFAIALFDKQQRRLLLVRDRIGIKPLYYTRTDEGLLFASEIKALFVHGGVQRKLNPSFLAQQFTFWTGLDTLSPFEGIHQVEAGTVHVFDQSGRSRGQHKYWDIPYRATVSRFGGSFDECQEAFREVLGEAVKLRLQADVEVGTYTSGGVDSSVINVVANKDLQHENTRTFSVAFEDQMFDESSFQRLMADHLQLKSHVVTCSRDAIYESFPNVVFHTEAPIFRTAPAPMFLLSRRVRDAGVKVVLTGEGSDEIAWGYDIFREAKIRRFWSRQPQSRVRPQLFRKLYDYLPQFRNKRHFQLLVDFFRKDMEQTESPLYSHHTRIANSSATHVFLAPELKQEIALNPPLESLIDSLPADFPDRSLMEKCQYLEMRTLLHGYLLSSQGDRMLSAHGVEGRFPFLDHHVIEFLAGIPESFRLRGLRDKAILRETFRPDLPASISDRPKFAFRAPELSAFLQDSQGIVARYLDDTSIREAGVFDPDAVHRFRHRLSHTPSDRFTTRDNLAFVQIFSTQILHDQFVKRFRWLQVPGSRSDVTITRNASTDEKSAAA